VDHPDETVDGRPISVSAVLARTRRAERLVLCFHGVGSPPDWIPEPERPFWCDELSFGSILDSIDAVSRRAAVPIVLTFDDGNMSDATIALPALQERDLTATFFVCAGRLGQPGYLDGPAVQTLSAAGMRVGSHGWAHTDWREADEATLDREIDQARHELSGLIDAIVDTVAVPFGSYDRRVLSRLRRSRIRKIFTSDGGRASLDGAMIPRETYETWWDDTTLEYLATRTVPSRARVRRAAGRALRQFR